MELKDWQGGPIECAVRDYIRYVVPNQLKSDITAEQKALMYAADRNLHNVLCLFFKTSEPDPDIKTNLDSGKWIDPEEVTDYIEAMYYSYPKKKGL